MASIKTLDSYSLMPRQFRVLIPRFWSGEEHSMLLQVVRCRYLLASKQFDVLRARLNNLDPLLDSTLEIQQCRGDFAALVGDLPTALRDLAVDS